MAEYQGPEFVGIVEYIHETPSYHYCRSKIEDGSTAAYPDVEILGETIAILHGENFRQKITYEPPQGIDTRETERRLCSRRYHRLSVLEQDRFEKSVLGALKGKK